MKDMILKSHALDVCFISFQVSPTKKEKGIYFFFFFALGAK